MCPSFQATRDEMHSTRGRANLLRTMISTGIEKWESEIVDDVRHALDLCLACKGCKAECPSGVDMAKLKYEFENEYYKTHRRQLRDYVFGYFHITAALATSIAPLSNALIEVPVIKNLVAKILGITSYRPFPKFSRRVPQISATEPQRRGDKIIFLSDPFSRYIEPQVEQAALDVLHQCGYDIHVLPIIGAGASLLSKGFIGATRHHARKLLDTMNQIDPARDAFIVGVEPPEVYALKHDYVDLLPEYGDKIARRAERTWLLDEFLLRSEEFSSLRVASIGQLSDHANKPSTKIYFHPHCHQRAEGPASDGISSGTTATIDLLHACGYDVELLNTGCCGMAGSFGYEAE
ncbi:MAG: 4Fe-4S dicluster domain-containing protein, partial [Anaerolineae bacterium]|nr:4Fe-4S dicluster domain-containing protein [Anaerolineae bacterium]